MAPEDKEHWIIALLRKHQSLLFAAFAVVVILAMALTMIRLFTAP